MTPEICRAALEAAAKSAETWSAAASLAICKSALKWAARKEQA